MVPHRSPCHRYLWHGRYSLSGKMSAFQAEAIGSSPFTCYFSMLYEHHTVFLDCINMMQLLRLIESILETLPKAPTVSVPPFLYCMNIIQSLRIIDSFLHCIMLMHPRCLWQLLRLTESILLPTVSIAGSGTSGGGALAP